MFNLGDVVKLARGWTPMVVIRLNDDGTITAKYANNSWDYVKECDYETGAHRSYSSSHTYTRMPHQFKAWTGSPIPKGNFIMTDRYKSKTHPHVCGKFLSTTSNGSIVIEADNGNVHVIKDGDAVRDVPFTFEVKATNSGSNYTCHYTLPHPSASISEGDMLISESGNTYIVRKLDTERANNKGPFKGWRVLKEAL